MSFALILGVAAGVMTILIAPVILTRWKIAWTLYLICITFNGLSVPIGPATFRVDLLALPLLVAILVSTQKRSSRMPKHFWLIGALFGGWVAVAVASSAFYAPEPLSSFGVVSWVLLGMSTFMVASRIDLPIVDMVRIGTVVVGVISGVTVIFWVAALSGVTSPLVLVEAGQIPRSVALSFEPNIFGGFATLWVALVSYWRAYLTRATFVWTAVIAIAGVLSMTRAAWVALLVVLLPVIFSNARALVRAIAAVTLAVLAVPLLLGDAARLVVQPIADRLGRLTDFETGTAAFRFGAWQAAWDDVTGGNWLIGVGVNTFTQRHRLAVDLKQTDYLSNAWLAQVHDVGVFGAALLLAAFILVWRSAQDVPRAFPFFVAFFLTSTFTSALWFAFPWLLMGLFRFDGSADPLAHPRNSHVRLFPVGARS